MMLNLQPVQEQDILEVELNYVMTPEARVAFTKNRDIRGFALWQGPHIVAIGGVHLMWHGVAEGWFLMGSRGYDTPLLVARYSKRGLDAIITDNKIRRVQASVSVVDDVAVRFAEWMGFDEEGVMRAYGLDGSDYYRYARVS